MRRKFWPAVCMALLMCAVFMQSAFAEDASPVGLWQYQEIVVTEDQQQEDTDHGEQAQGVLLSDLQSMPLGLLGKVFGKLAYTAEFTGDARFQIEISVLGMRFHAEGSYSLQDGEMTLVYDTITGFEKLWWLGSFDHLTHCDAEHTMQETVPYAIAGDTLTFYSNGANAVFTWDMEPES